MTHIEVDTPIALFMVATMTATAGLMIYGILTLRPWDLFKRHKSK